MDATRMLTADGEQRVLVIAHSYFIREHGTATVKR